MGAVKPCAQGIIEPQSIVCALYHRGSMQQGSPCPGRNPAHMLGHLLGQELGSQEEIWLKAFRVLCWPCPASAGGFFPRGGPSTSHTDARWGSKLFRPIHMDTIPGGGGHPSSTGTTAGFPLSGWGALGPGGACAQEGGELTALMFSRLSLALACDPGDRKDAANTSSPGAGPTLWEEVRARTAFQPRWCCFQQQFNISPITQARLQALVKQKLRKNLLTKADVLS
ncbi:uncharacterized protein ACIB01_014105 [Guaruba guarouba]